MRRTKTRVIALLCAGLLLSAGRADEAPRVSDSVGPTEPGAAMTVRARYSGSVLIFQVGRIYFNATLGPDWYSSQSHVEAAGLAALFTDFDIDSEVEGRLRADGVAVPDRYGHVERTGDKVRSVNVSFAGPHAISTVEPPFGSWGVPPASETDRTGVIDPMSAFLQLSSSIEAEAGEACSGSIPVFDGKARYDLRLESAGPDRVRTPAWRGEALLCRAWYEPIAGYDPEDYPSEDELRHPLNIWLAPIGDGQHYLPVRMHTAAGFGGVTIEAVEISVEAG